MTRLLALLLIITVAPITAYAQSDTREFYLSPIDGDGTESNPFRSRCLGRAGSGNVDLRTDATKAAGYMMCASDTLPADLTGVVQLGSSLNAPLSGKTKGDAAAAGKAIVGGTVDEAIKEYVIPLMKLPKSGTYDIYLGKHTPTLKVAATFQNDLYYKGIAVAIAERANDAGQHMLASLDTAVVWAATLATETFTNSNGDLGGRTHVHAWTEFTGTGWAIASNQATVTTSNTEEARNDSTLASTDMRVSVTVVATTTGGAGTATTCGLIARKENNATRTFYNYRARYETTGSALSTELVKIVAATATVIATDATDWANNDVLLLEVTGSSLVGKLQGTTVVSATDTSVTDGTYGGIRYFSDSASGACTVDSQNEEDITSGRNRGTQWYN